MIVSHRHKFIFIKTKKTAGSSLELALSSLCGPDDIITPLLPEEEAIRPGPGPQNYRRSCLRALPKRCYDRLIKGRMIDRSGFYGHIPAWRARDYLGPEIWNNYFKFCVERNPWDRQVSYYFYRKGRRGDGDLTFEQFLDQPEAPLDNHEIYTIEGKLVVDAVLKYENLKEDLQATLCRAGFKDMPPMPLTKRHYRSDRGDYRSHYTEASRALIGEWYRSEVELFGYTFDPPEGLLSLRS